jgi:hypothetical protein
MNGCKMKDSYSRLSELRFAIAALNAAAGLLDAYQIEPDQRLSVNSTESIISIQAIAAKLTKINDEIAEEKD